MRRDSRGPPHHADAASAAAAAAATTTIWIRLIFFSLHQPASSPASAIMSDYIDKHCNINYNHKKR